MPCSSCKARGHSCRMISSNSRCSGLPFAYGLFRNLTWSPKRLFQSRSEAEAVRLDAELSVKDAVERDRLGVDELPFDGPSKSGLVPELRSLGHVDVVDWSSVLGADPQNWVFADLAPGNDPTPGSIDGVVPGNSGGG
ncbi:hypothetical protein MGG_16311 [Pyricularia oryzae 70-15]|uniref:Uncharacterized protein n=1 Tax=Pyricularia oryzae (strain 70-15 / ATCC MYA-4617 / FGSC 8958) TaxID=242507 RepID=G4MS41_PYRO7|nr:uncharacterized protein MGG_16311 [Pyricularia oryzae 70-15]EHA57507.1 hypothetical protein MGG_16311 [Pyricularia oryzae 70-15]KAI7908747.1 hypothetical protein M0657_012152 [Pyricularia oryzae]KAI7909301.1 hypothetical protein M9X92_011709 [Pyricularia oryzae]